MKKRLKEILILLFLLISVTASVVIGTFKFSDEKFYAVSVAIIILAMIPFFFAFERKKLQTREIVVIASLTALSVAGRALFFMLPQVKPTCALVMIFAVSLGGEVGFFVGSLSMFLSNFLFGQGAWTPFQMFGMGLAAFLIGMIFEDSKLKNNRIVLSLAGGVICFAVYGFIVDTNSAIMMTTGGFKQALPVYISGLPFNAVHGVVTAIIIFFAGNPVIEKIERIKIKYGIFRRTE